MEGLSFIFLMLRIVFFILFLFQCSVVIAQPKFKTLIIDTVIDNGYSGKFHVSQTSDFILTETDYLEDSAFIYKRSQLPNYIGKVKLLNDTSVIHISIDNEGGFLELRDLYNFAKDTIRIDKIVLYDNCLRDTTFTTIWYFWKDSVGIKKPAYKIKRKKEIGKRKKCKNKMPQFLSYKINSKEYIVQKQVVEVQTEVVMFNGHKPTRYRKNPENFKGKLTKFHGASYTWKSVNMALIKF